MTTITDTQEANMTILRAAVEVPCDVGRVQVTPKPGGDPCPGTAIATAFIHNCNSAHMTGVLLCEKHVIQFVKVRAQFIAMGCPIICFWCKRDLTVDDVVRDIRRL